MLILTRKRYEKVILTTKSGERIELTTVEIRGDKVRLGFNAGPEVMIHREEIQERVERSPAPIFPVSPLAASPVPVA